jgi:hypothetical protein
MTKIQRAKELSRHRDKRVPCMQCMSIDMNLWKVGIIETAVYIAFIEIKIMYEETL